MILSLPAGIASISLLTDAGATVANYRVGVERAVRLPRYGPVAVDVVVALGVTVLVQFSVWRGDGPDETFTHRPLSSAVLLVVTASLLLRRRAPLAVAVVVGGGLVLEAVVTSTFSQPPALALCGVVALYSVGAWASPTRAVAGGVVVAAAIQIKSLLVPPTVPDDSPFVSMFWWLLVASVVGVGVLVRSMRRSQALQVEETRRESERRAHAQAAVTEERQRIARELHDVVSHHVSASLLQAGAAEELLHRQPDRAVEALRSIQKMNREALGEMRRLVGIMRLEDNAPAPPQPRISDLGELLKHARDTGLETSLVVKGDPAPLAPGVELSAYRIVQEALTNVRRHASAARAVVTLRYDDAWLDLEVVDDGLGAKATDDGTGHGLVGMRERVEFLGGEMTVGPRPEGGYAVLVRLPTYRSTS